MIVDYTIIEKYRKARGFTWKELFAEMALRDVDVATIRKLALMPLRRPRRAIARKLDGWLTRNAGKIKEAIAGVKP